MAAFPFRAILKSVPLILPSAVAASPAWGSFTVPVGVAPHPVPRAIRLPVTSAPSFGSNFLSRATLLPKVPAGQPCGSDKRNNSPEVLKRFHGQEVTLTVRLAVFLFPWASSARSW